MKHSKGKWHLKNVNPNDLHIRQGEKGKIICDVVTTGILAEQEEAEANAKLIAAAPELLEALQHLCKTVRPYIMKLGTKKGFSEMVALAEAEKVVYRLTNEYLPKFVITAIKKDGLRHMAFTNNHLNTHTEEEAQQRLKDVLTNNSPEQIKELIGEQLEVTPVLCYPTGDSTRTVF